MVKMEGIEPVQVNMDNQGGKMKFCDSYEVGKWWRLEIDYLSENAGE